MVDLIKIAEIERGYEEPLPISHRETLGEFNDAIAKARLLYEHIQVAKESQFALLSNENSLGGSEYYTLYISRKDNKAHITELGYDIVTYGKPGIKDDKGNVFFKEGCYTIRNKTKIPLTMGSMPWIEKELRGMAAHNGVELIPPKFIELKDILNSFIICETYLAGETEVYDYYGNRMFSIFGDVDRHTKLSAWQIDDRDAMAILACEEYKTGNQSYFVVNNGNMYRIWESDGPDCHILFSKDVAIIIENGKQADRFTREEVLDERGLVAPNSKAYTGHKGRCF